MKAKELYDADFLEWTVHNAELLRLGRFTEADIEHIVEELEDMGKSQQRELSSRLRVLLTHLLKWQAQPERRQGSTWKSTIRVQRLEISKLLRQAPSLRPTLPEETAEVYPASVSEAADETGVPEEAFPSSCPFTAEQILDDGYLPG